MLRLYRRWKDKNVGLHDAADVSDEQMKAPKGWIPVEVDDTPEFARDGVS